MKQRTPTQLLALHVPLRTNLCRSKYAKNAGLLHSPAAKIFQSGAPGMKGDS
jgi:hypothetical protein